MVNYKIGDKLYRFDVNHRIYSEDNKSRPIYEEYFIEYTITSEDEKHYFVDGEIGNGFSVLKRTGNLILGNERYKLLTEQEKADKIWIQEQGRNIVVAVGACTDVEKLKQIQELLK